MLNRRHLLGAGAALGLLPPGSAAFAGPGSGAAADQEQARLLQHFTTQFLRRSPEEATGLGFDTGAEAGLRSRLDDRSLAARTTDIAAVAEARRQLARLDRAALSPAARLDHDVARFVLDTLADTLAQPGYVDINLRPSPYVVSQMNGAYYWLPDFLGSRHPLQTPDDLEAWFARLAALAVALDQETARIAHDAGLGIVPPDFVIARTLPQLKALRDGPPLASALIAPALGRAAARRLPDPAPRALALFNQQIAPALSRQIAALEAVAPRARSDAGVWALPDGERYYASALAANTTTTLTAETLHQSGLDQCAALVAEISALLDAQGIARGAFADRLRALDADARFLVSNDDAGRQRILDAVDAHLAAITARLPKAFGNTHVAPLVVRRIPPEVEGGAPGAFYNEGAPGEPGIFSLNLKDPAEHPLWRLPTLIHHEAIPGHHFQYSVLGTQSGLAPFRRLVRFSAYTEGWALYAEQLADELGVYDGNPAGRIGALQSQLFRAARIVVDTGLHHKRWTLEEGTRWMIENAGQPETATRRELVRYSVYPGQACSFKVGANRILAARAAAQAQRGARFDPRGFHDLILQSGPMPLSVLEAALAEWSARA
jgi:uncharacterized protein (DUF885 family)